MASGEKIVVSALLESRYSSSLSFGRGSKFSEGATPEQPVTINLDEAMPRSIEMNILRLRDTLQSVESLWYVDPFARLALDFLFLTISSSCLAAPMDGPCQRSSGQSSS